MSKKIKKYFVIMNPVSGSSNPDSLKKNLNYVLGKNYSLYTTTGKEQMEKICQKAADEGYEVIIAAGGDGTITHVANGMISRPLTLGIIPLGTANVLAKELHIPLDIEASLKIIKDSKKVLKLDAMKLKNKYCFLDIGIGIKSLTIKETARHFKRLFGIWAYIITGFRWFIGWQPRRFWLDIDGTQVSMRATEITIANVGTFGIEALRYGPHIHPNDGVLNVCVMKNATLISLIIVLWSFFRKTHRYTGELSYFTARNSVYIRTSKPTPVQADGEIIGTTPVEIFVKRRVINVISGGE